MRGLGIRMEVGRGTLRGWHIDIGIEGVPQRLQAQTGEREAAARVRPKIAPTPYCNFERSKC